MRAIVVRHDFFREMATTSMSDYVELINPADRTCTLLKNGEVVDRYKLEQCDKCSMLAKLDEFGYQRGQKGEKLLWFCGGCR
jgi:hypothetical protein